MNALAPLVFLALLMAMSAVAVLGGLWLGSIAYVVWRDGARQQLADHDPIASALLGKYRSPFPWHADKKQTRDKKVA